MHGPAVSLKGSPTVSPVTDALGASEPLHPWAPPSMYYGALSQAPPAMDMNKAMSTPLEVTPARTPPSMMGLRSTRPKNTGVSSASRAGTTISLIAAAVEMSTQRA